MNDQAYQLGVELAHQLIAQDQHNFGREVLDSVGAGLVDGVKAHDKSLRGVARRLGLNFRTVVRLAGVRDAPILSPMLDVEEDKRTTGDLLDGDIPESAYIQYGE